MFGAIAVLAIVAAAAEPYPAGGLGLDFEVGAAYSEFHDQFAPAASLRAAYDLGVVSPAVRGGLVFGNKASEVGAGTGRDPSGFQAWALLGELSFHSPGPDQVGVRVGGGLGKLIGVQCNCPESSLTQGTVGPVFSASGFFRLRPSALAPNYRAGLELGVLHFWNIHYTSDQFRLGRTGLEMWAGLLTLSLQWSP